MDVNVKYRVGVGGNIAGVDWRINEDYLSEKIGKNCDKDTGIETKADDYKKKNLIEDCSRSWKKLTFSALVGKRFFRYAVCAFSRLLAFDRTFKANLEKNLVCSFRVSHAMPFSPKALRPSAISMASNLALQWKTI
ncbi:hypothetical protein P5673_027202 [Acropora cervicornis]|uniref:Uncharacterized protein n=1 Tax=Acropora cervicornis TaxID=6130 RepID=A0AAD9PZY6_ACRCE|nr:hypothetical protein P5673_027202 [Acropora cervicornis]